MGNWRDSLDHTYSYSSVYEMVLKLAILALSKVEKCKIFWGEPQRKEFPTLFWKIGGCFRPYYSYNFVYEMVLKLAIQ